MRGTQFLAAASANPDHPCHFMLAHQPTPRSIKTTPQALYTGLLNTIFTHPHALQKYSHTKTRSEHNIRYSYTEMHHSEHALPRADRVHLSWLRYGHYNELATYRKSIDDSVKKVCIHCSINTHSLTHIMTHCPAVTHIRAQHNISSPLDLWHASANSLLFLKGAGLLGQTSFGTTTTTTTIQRRQ